VKHPATSKLLAVLAVLVLAAAGAAAASTSARTASPAEQVRALERARPERLDRLAPQRRLIDLAQRPAHHDLPAGRQHAGQVVGEACRRPRRRSLDRDEPSARPRVVEELVGDPVEQQLPVGHLVHGVGVHAVKATPERMPRAGRVRRTHARRPPSTR